MARYERRLEKCQAEQPLRTGAGECPGWGVGVRMGFAGDKPVPPGGFAECAAFDPDGPLAARLRTEHDLAMRDLYYGTDEPPTFDDVLERVRAGRDLLDIEATP